MRKALSVGSVILLAVALAFALTTGPTFPTAATGNTNTVGGGTVAWTNPQNIEANDGASATCLPGIAITDDLVGGVFGFSIPAGNTIKGIFLEVSANTPATTNVEKFNNVRLLKAGVAVGTDHATATTLTPTPTIFTYGSSSDLWGTTWTPTDINGTGFGALINMASTVGGPGTLQVDFFRITITSTAPSSGFLNMFSKNRPPQVRTQTRTLWVAKNN
jgi:hypothetical protein